METAKLFQNGSSQAVRLPKAFRIPGNEVKIFKKGNQVYWSPLKRHGTRCLNLSVNFRKIS